MTVVDHDLLALEARTGGGLILTRLGQRHSESWLANVDGPLFSATIDGNVLASNDPSLRLSSASHTAGDGFASVTSRVVQEDIGLEFDHHLVSYELRDVAKLSWSLTNVGDSAVRVSNLETLAVDLLPEVYRAWFYSSSWGEEFESVERPIPSGVMLETRAGRASNEHHPWLTLRRADGSTLTTAVMWSGNWFIAAQPDVGGFVRLAAGLSNWQFEATVEPGASVHAAPVVIAVGADSDLNDTSINLAAVGRKHWYRGRGASLGVEWNNWWPYEDEEINEDVFRRNVEVARRIGIEVCVLDAGWFGPDDTESQWFDHRGDWDHVNSARFPSGLRALADHVRDQGMEFGLWVEIEGLGRNAALARSHPEFKALRGAPALVERDAEQFGQDLGYVCMGNPDVQDWACATLDRIITDYGCSWIKLDFNVDPGAGCNRIDHGHGALDGLYAHYRGYYRVLERVAAAHPDVVLENCSSGGLRIDLGMAERTNAAFLSDPDWPEHNLQLFWGASSMLAPNVCLHWPFSQWRTPHPEQTFDPHAQDLTQYRLDYYIRTAMLGAFGLSQRLIDIPDWVVETYARHIRTYQEVVRRFVEKGDLYRLTDQPKRRGRGARWAAFQYRLPTEDEHLLFAFRLPGGEQTRVLRLRDLDPAGVYAVSRPDREDLEPQEFEGEFLMETGLDVSHLREEESDLIFVKLDG